MAKKFGGFTEQQKEVLARRMGYDGPIDQFGKFLQSSPAHQQKFLSYETKAKQMVEGAAPQQPKPQASFAAGGVVTPTTALPAIPNTTVPPTSNWAGNTITAEMINNPSSVTPQVKVEEMTTAPEQFIAPTSGQVEKSEPVATAAGTAPTAQVAPVATTPAPTVITATTAAPVASATQGMQAAQGTVSEQAKVEAVTALPSANATVQGQLTNLMSQFGGAEPPAWAAGALRNANALMAQRGLGSSSIAASAATQAAMESSIQIAAQDAATFSQFEMQNLNNRQQARLVNAQSFLQMDLANLDAEQQMTMFKSQSIIQSLFTDQAAENASRQFNATSQGQTDQFFASLKTQVQQFNVAQTNAMEQFKAGQTDSVNMFNRQMNDAAEQFNASNRLVIDQSNAEWRRAVTTANNATINEANRINAQTESGMTMAAYNNLMQRERDFYSFAFTAGENQLNRANELALAKLGISAADREAAASRSSSMWSAVGSLGAALISRW